MRVTLVIQKLAGIRGGAERVTVDLGNALAERGHDVTIATFEPAAGVPAYELRGVDVVPLFPRLPVPVGLRRNDSLDTVEDRLAQRRRRRSFGPLDRTLWWATHGWFARRLERWLRTSPQDVIVGFLPPAISAVACAAGALGAARPRVVASTHNVPDIDFGTDGRWDPNPVARRRNLDALEAADVVTVLQPEFIEQLPSGARERALVMPNAVTRLGSSGAERADLVLGVGRLTDVKRYDLLVRAFARIAPDAPGWRLAIFGDGPCRSELEALIGDLGLADRAMVQQSTPLIGEQYDAARVLVHPAQFEGFGLSVAEAILHGLVVVASGECSGVNRLVVDGATGYLVDEVGLDPVDAFADGLRRAIFSPPDQQRRSVAAERLAAELSPAAVYARWEELLVGGLGVPPPTP